MTRLLLLRHGESTWNADGRWQGQADPPLSARGERQAADAAARVGPIDAVWSSDLARARRTAEIMAEQLGIAVRTDVRLRERHAGEWQGRTRAEIEAGWPGYLGAGTRPPGYEPDEALLERALVALGEIVAAHRGQSVLLVVHGGVLRTVERHLGDDAPGLLANLGGRWVLGVGEPVVWSLGERVLLVDPARVTVPKQI